MGSRWVWGAEELRFVGGGADAVAGSSQRMGWVKECRVRARGRVHQAES